MLIAGSIPALSANLLLVVRQVLIWKSNPQTSSGQSHRRNLLFKSVVFATRGGTKGNSPTMISTVSVLTDIIDWECSGLELV